MQDATSAGCMCSRTDLWVSQKPQKSPGQDKKQRTRKKKTKQTLTRAVTHIRLIEANPGKLEVLDQLIAVYLPLCQQYVSLLCTQEADPDKFAIPSLRPSSPTACIESSYSRRQASPDPGAPTDKPPTMPIWKRSLIGNRRRSRSPILSARNPNGANGSCLSFAFLASRPMQT